MTWEIKRQDVFGVRVWQSIDVSRGAARQVSDMLRRENGQMSEDTLGRLECNCIRSCAEQLKHSEDRQVSVILRFL